MTLSSARETLKSHSTLRAVLPAFEFSLPSHYAHCPQPPPLIDLGPVPVSNCFLQIGFAPNCWLLSSNFSPPYCALSFPKKLAISWAACVWPVNSYQGQKKQGDFLKIIITLELQSTWKKQIPRSFGFFSSTLPPPLPRPFFPCMWMYCGCPPCYSTENFSRDTAGWRIWDLLSTYFSAVFPTATHFSGWIWKSPSLWKRVGGGASDPLFSVCLHYYSVFPWQGNVLHIIPFSP